MPLNQAGIRTGVFILLSGIGLISGGWLTDRWAGPDPKKRLSLITLFVACSGFSLCLALLLPAGSLQLTLLYFGGLLVVAFVGPIVTLIQDQVPLTMAVSALGIWVTLNNVLGMALGPALAGLLSDQSNLQHALLQVCSIALIGTVLLLMSKRLLVRS